MRVGLLVGPLLAEPFFGDIGDGRDRLGLGPLEVNLVGRRLPSGGQPHWGHDSARELTIAPKSGTRVMPAINSRPPPAMGCTSTPLMVAPIWSMIGTMTWSPGVSVRV